MIKRTIKTNLKQTKYFHDEKYANLKLGNDLFALLPTNINRQIVITCIGTDRSTGDCLGPLVGTLLKERKINRFSLYGTLDDPIHALNLEEKFDYINKNYDDPFIIAVDACLGSLKSIGSLQIGDGPLKPGAGVKKQLPPVGNIHLTGVVNVSGFMELHVLQNTRLSLVMSMAKKIASGIYYAHLLYNSGENLRQFTKEKEQIAKLH